MFFRGGIWDSGGGGIPQEIAGNNTGIEVWRIGLSEHTKVVGAIEERSNLRSAATGQLCVLRTKTVTIDPREFAVSSPTAWNNLSVDLRDPNLSLSCFRKKLKNLFF